MPEKSGCRTVFEKKIQDEEPWKLYKRAYKKYYARFMKGNMSKEDFKAWVEQASADREEAIQQLESDAGIKFQTITIEQLREKLNRA